MKSKAGHFQININLSNIGFYKDLFDFLGWSVICDDPSVLGVGDENGVSLWFTGATKDVKNDYDGCGTNHIAIGVSEQKDVDEAVNYLRSHQLQTLFETPRHRPDFCPDPSYAYYQVMFESPDRLLFEIVYTHAPAK